ncbi:tRNA lysidine(34) synthetase TilS, partial [Moraxella sp.]|uniref:tRNA lysidine(34) synthetase TilS n=1 Tax=Moraxella sp. TaxID=479 RepID=UPI0026017F0A
IKKLFIDRKINRAQRRRIPLLTDGNHILWVVGVRRSGRAIISDNTRQVLKVEVCKIGAEVEYQNDHDPLLKA